MRLEKKSLNSEFDVSWLTLDIIDNDESAYIECFIAQVGI